MQIVQRNAWLLLLDLVVLVISELEVTAEFSSDEVSFEVNDCCLIDSSASNRLLVVLLNAADVLVSVLFVDETFTVET